MMRFDRLIYVFRTCVLLMQSTPPQTHPSPSCLRNRITDGARTSGVAQQAQSPEHISVLKKIVAKYTSRYTSLHSVNGLNLVAGNSFLRPYTGEVDDGLHGFLHILYAHIFLFAMEGHFPGKKIRTRQAHE